MRLILLGPPGSGKGTQAKLLCQRLGLCHFSTGDILREAVRNGTSAGRKAQAIMAAGHLVSDEIVNEIVAARFRNHDRPERFVMDGYPRTLAQALAFDDVLKSQSLDLSGVVSLVLDDSEVVRRLGGRWSCPNPTCMATYHMVTKPPKKPGICDECQTHLVQREDDREETIRNRLAVFHRQNDGLVNHYQGQGLLREIAGQGDIEDVYAKIIEAIKGKDVSKRGQDL